MATNYPGSLDSWTNPSSTTELSDTGFEHDLVHSNVYDAIEAIEGELGTDPAGVWATVKERSQYADMAISGAFPKWWNSGTYALLGMNSATGQSGALSSPSIFFTPWLAPATRTVDRVAIEVTALVASAHARIGLYSVNLTNGRPDSLITDFGEVDCSTNGVKELTVSQSVTGGQLYYWSLLNELGVGYSLVAGSAAGYYFSSSNSSGVMQARLYADRTYASGFPSDASVLTFQTTTTGPPNFRLRCT